MTIHDKLRQVREALEAIYRRVSAVEHYDSFIACADAWGLKYAD